MGGPSKMTKGIIRKTLELRKIMKNKKKIFSELREELNEAFVKS